MTAELTTLGRILNKGDDYDAGHFLYLPMDEIWELETKCAVLSESDLEGVPAVAQQNNLSYAVGIAALQDVIANAREQRDGIEDPLLLQAFLFYYDQDAFILFGG
ncbi:MAG: hypothetical protein R3C18_18435 [Planctomycetaceae bacterium]